MTRQTPIEMLLILLRHIFHFLKRDVISRTEGSSSMLAVLALCQSDKLVYADRLTGLIGIY